MSRTDAHSVVPASESQLLMGDTGKPAYHIVNREVIKAFSIFANSSHHRHSSPLEGKLHIRRYN
ncbi:hypothetical protein SAMN05421858_0479 [Haladaptatus litoreus]|uniref:Uncharacterized protein n=1 Tax=Haladaptatus litoreus TaxID=553468 RepID=A0A1N6VTE5_9EURY|nr:hypothetical protein SAMN05421858_0479 [Haladaptatus litoreus]